MAEDDLNKKKERRRFSRIERRAGVTLEVAGKKFSAVVLNLSEVGLLIESPEGFPAGSQVQVPMNVGARKVTKVDGIVRWMSETQKPKKSFTMGIELNAVPAEFLKAIADLRKTSKEKSVRGPEERYEMYHEVAFQSGDNFLSEYTENISRGGMYIATKEPLAPGSTIQARLALPGESEPITIEGRVSYRLDEITAAERGRTPGVGIQFVNVSDSVRSRINHYIQRLTVHRSTAERRWSGPVPRSGSLNDFLVPELLVNLATQDSTGVLILERGEIQKKVFFEKGKVISVESPLPSESLGHYISSRGKIPLNKLAECIKLWHPSDSVLVQRLVDAQVLDREPLFAALIQCSEDRLTNTFTWFDGRFQFQDGSDWKTTITILPTQVHRLIFEGVTRWYDAKLVASWMGLDERTKIRSRLPSTVKELPEEAYRIIHASWGERSLEEISAEASIPIETLIPAVYALVIAGWMELVFANTSSPGGRSTVSIAQSHVSQPSFAPQADDLLKRIEDDYNRMKGLDYLELLGVNENSGEDEIRRAYSTRAERYSETDEQSEKARAILSWLQIAVDTLTSPSLRSIYLKERAQGTLKDDSFESFELDRELLTAISEIQKDQFTAALVRLAPLVEKYPNHAGIMGWYGWTLYCEKGTESRKEALTLVDRAINTDPSDPNLYYFLGQLWFGEKEMKKAEQAFLQAVRLQANYGKARDMLDRVRSQLKDEPTKH